MFLNPEIFFNLISFSCASFQGSEHQNFQLSKVFKTLTLNDVIIFNIGPNCFIFEALKYASLACYITEILS